MDKTPNVDFYADLTAIAIPEVGLGQCTAGYTEEKPLLQNVFQVLWCIALCGAWIFWVSIIIPDFVDPDRNVKTLLVEGAITVMAGIGIVNHIYKKLNPHRILLYEGGFVMETLNIIGVVSKTEVFNFNEINGLKYREKAEYTTRRRKYGASHKIRTGTTFVLSILDSQFKEKEVLRGSVSRAMAGHAFIETVCDEIYRLWLEFESYNVDRILASKGSVVFKIGHTFVTVGKDQIKINDAIVSNIYSYAMEGGILGLVTECEENGVINRNEFKIDYREMYNQKSFLYLLAHYHNMEFPEIHWDEDESDSNDFFGISL